MAQVVQILLLFRFASRATDPNLIVNSQDLFMVLRFLFFALTMFATQVDLMAQTLAQKLLQHGIASCRPNHLIT